jgi:hypothetical protein
VARTYRRSLARLAVICVLFTLPLAAAGCGAGSNYVINRVAHGIANHFAKTPAQKRAVNKAFCVYSVYRAFHDVRHHHLIFGALNAVQALHNCEAGFAKSSP